MWRIRDEQAGDEEAIFAVHAAAFPTDAEARLVDALRGARHLVLSLVAEIEGRVIGHVAWSPVSVEGCSSVPSALGLAPVAVLPAEQHRGVGGALVRTGLERCRSAAVPFVVVLGEPAYYGRFGFVPASRFALLDEHGGADAFMVQATSPSGLDGVRGLVRYGLEFAAL